jgi:predicted Zn-dependent peptidase
LLDLVSDIVINPVFKQEELEKIRTQTLSSIAANKNDPEAIARDVIGVLNFGIDHPYGEIATEGSVKNVSLEKCNEYYQTFFRPNVAYMSIVGDITLAEAKPLIEKYFGKWEKKTVPVLSFEKPTAPISRKVAIVNRDESVQSVINIGYAVDVTLSNPDYIKTRVANTILGGGTYRLFDNLREKHGYTYGAYSSIRSMPLVGSFTASTNVRNEVTDSSIYEILSEMDRMRNELVPDDELMRVKNYMTGNFALSLENPQTIASFAINTERYKLSKDFYKNYLKNLSLVNSADVQAVSKKYILPQNCYILVVGKADEVAKKLARFSPDIKYYTEEGVEYDPNAKGKAVPAGVTVNLVLDNYIKAIGGADKISQIKDMKQKGSFSVQGMNIAVEMTQKFPDKALTVIQMGTNLINKSVFNSDKATSSGMQGNRDVSGLEFDMLKLQALIFPDNKLEQYGFKATLNGIEQIDGKDAYSVVVATPSNGTYTDYFEVASGLKIKTIALLESPAGKVKQETSYIEYIEKDGIKYPNKIKQITGPQSFDIIIDSIEVNTNPSDELFKL